MFAQKIALRSNKTYFIKKILLGAFSKHVRCAVWMENDKISFVDKRGKVINRVPVRADSFVFIDSYRRILGICTPSESIEYQILLEGDEESYLQDRHNLENAIKEINEKIY
jgi:hypothetical protein